MSETDKPRLNPRIRLRIRIDVTPRWKEAAPVPMETIDLGTTGVACRSTINMPLRTQAGIAMRLPAVGGLAERDLRCEAVVVNIERMGRGRSEWRVGLYFLNLQEADMEALRRLVFNALGAWLGERQRRAAGR